MSDGVETRHPSYQLKEYEWRQLRDTADGMSAVKRSGSLYLPIPTAMISNNTNAPAGLPTDNGILINTYEKDTTLKNHAPWYDSNVLYSSYLQRARFPDIVASTIMGLVGIATKQNPEIELPTSISYLENNATKCGMSLDELFEYCVTEVLTTGRVELLVDVDRIGNPFIVPYNAESFINWKGCGEKLSLAVFQEQVFGINDSDSDEFSQDPSTINLVLRLDDKNNYTSQIYVDGIPDEIYEFSVPGFEVDSIPLVIINSTRIGTKIETSPLLGISDIAISIYQKEADMSNSEFVTCNPMLVFIGVAEEDGPSVIGSNISYSIPNDQGDAKYVEPTANCLNHMSNRIENLLQEATLYGAALIGGSSSGESTETNRMKQEAKGATLKTIVKNVGDGIKKALDICAAMKGSSTDEVVFEPNNEFSELTLTSQEQIALLNSWMNGGISQDTYLDNLKKAGIIPEDRTIDEEKALITVSQPDIMT